MFVDREDEIAFLNSLLQRQKAQLILIYGRRRVGKTYLLRHWAETSARPCTYWLATKGTALGQRRELYAAIMGMDAAEAPLFDSWTSCWRAVGRALGDHPHILICDEFPYVAAEDRAALSSLQHAWDLTLRDSQVILILAGSQVHAMERILMYQSPLFGRFSGQWWVRPLPYAALAEYFPRWSPQERVAGYSILGGIPGYWEWLEPKQNLNSNIYRLIAPGSMAVSEPAVLLYDEISDPSTHLAVLKAIGTGHHAFAEISNWASVDKKALTAYLNRLQQLHLVERRLPITIEPNKRRTRREGRYHITDAFLRFYFRFIYPAISDLSYKREGVLASIREGLRAFVGAHGFEDLCRNWVVQQSQAGRLPFSVREVGQHWATDCQVDVVGIDWPGRHVLLGECKWGTEPVDRSVVRTLIEDKGAKVLKQLPKEGAGWSVYYALFSRAGFTDAARARAEESGALLVDLERLDADLIAAAAGATSGSGGPA